MGSILTNGVFLPAEGERNCYEGLAANWTALDRLIGGYNAHIGNATIHVTAADKQAWNGKADASALTAHTGDTTIHVTAEDKNKWNGKADASALTAHTGDTTIHVTAADKQAWNGKADASALTAHTGDTTIHVTSADKQAWDGHVADSVKHVTAEDKAKWDAVTSKANDSDVVHTSGNETVGGVKTFSEAPYIYNSDSTGNIPNIIFKNSKYAKGDTTNTGEQRIIFADKNNTWTGSISSNKNISGTQYLAFTIYTTDNNNANLSSTINYFLTKNGDRYFSPSEDRLISFGGSDRRWKSFNGVEPSSLSLPSGNASDVIDISSYLVNLDGTTNTYTAPANGWIGITMSGCSDVQAYITGLWGHQVIRPSAGGVRFLMPILKNQTASIWIRGGAIDNARFIPCQGNV